MVQLDGLGDLLAAILSLTQKLKEASLPMVLSLDEAARELGIGRTALDRLIASGDIRTIRYEEGGHPKIPLAEIQRFIAEKLDEAVITIRPAISQPKVRKVRAGNAAAAELELEKLVAARRRRRGH